MFRNTVVSGSNSDEPTVISRQSSFLCNLGAAKSAAQVIPTGREGSKFLLMSAGILANLTNTPFTGTSSTGLPVTAVSSISSKQLHFESLSFGVSHVLRGLHLFYKAAIFVPTQNAHGHVYLWFEHACVCLSRLQHRFFFKARSLPFALQ